jgi:Fur family ferric uptake transcriptional regulator
MRASSVDQVIMETLSRQGAHLTSQQVFEAIRGRLPAVNPSTVYRSLERLVKRSLISVSDMGIGSAVYEALADGVHHHLVCQGCGKVQTIDHEEVRDFFAAVGEKNRFEVRTNHLVLFGLCEECRKKEE